MLSLDPADLKPQERYRLLIGCIAPRPIALVSTVDAEGRSNVAPYSFFNGIGSTPMSLLFCPASTPQGDKDTLRNCLPEEEGGQGEFVVNLAVEDNVQRAVAAAEALPFGQSEFDACGLTAAPCKVVAAPRVQQSPVSFECRTTHVIRLDPGEPKCPNVVIGRVEHIWVREGLLNSRYEADPEQLQLVGRMGGIAYCRTQTRFELPPGLAALETKPPFGE